MLISVMCSLTRPSPSKQTQYVTSTAKDSDSDPDNGNVELLRNPTARPAPSTRPRLVAVPDFDGRRYCRVCKDFLPLTSFPRGQRRFTCRTHLWQRVGKRAQKKLFDKPRKKMLARMWMRLWKDRCVFGQTRVGLKQADLDALLGDLHDRRVDQISILPVYPTRLLCRENAMIVDKLARRRLVQACREGGVQRYADELQRWSESGAASCV